MRPPVDHVRISAKAKEILIRMKKRTGLEHWNEICRIAYCRSLANPSPPAMTLLNSNIAIDIEWKTFAGQFQNEITAITMIRAAKDNIDLGNKEAVSHYFRAHLERGIASLQNIKSLPELAMAHE
jgi:DNA sulfur modification protein DndE